MDPGAGHASAESPSVGARPRPLVLDRVPGLAGRPFLPLARITPVERVPSLGPGVWAKRDDRVSALYGGNKIRRFEWLLASLLERGKRRVVTIGGLASTQVTATIAFGRALGLEVTAVLFDQVSTPYLREALVADLRLGGDLVYGGSIPRTAFRAARALARARDAAFIVPGASGPLANVGYVDAMLELAAQVEAGQMPRPDRIVVPCGSGGTSVGLAVGAALLGWPTTITAARIADLPMSNPLTLRAIAAATVRLLRREGLRAPRLRLRLEMDHRVIGDGYGFPTLAAIDGARRYGELFGAPGEVTYSGKALAAAALLAREHPEETLLVWNTLSTTGRSDEPPEAALVERAPEGLRRWLAAPQIT